MNRLLIVVTIVTGTAGGVAPADDELPMTAPARARQAAIRTIEVKFDVERVMEPGSGGVDGRGTPMPATRVVCVSPNRFVLDGSKVRLELTETLSHQGGPGHREVLVSDGERVSGYRGPLAGDVTRLNSHGHSGSPIRPGGILPFGVLPLTLACRGADPVAGPTLLTCALWRRVGPRFGWFGGMDEYELLVGDKSDRLRIWTDPTRDHIVVALHMNNSRLRMEISHRLHEGTGLWLPTGWTCVVHDSGGVLRSTSTATVTSIVVNRPRPAEDFELRFPQGIVVQDEWRKESDGGGEALAPVPPNAMRRNGVVVVSAVLATMLVAFVAARIRSRRRSAVPPT